MITVLRPGTGIPPKFVKNIIGLTIRKDVKEGNVLTWNMFKN